MVLETEKLDRASTMLKSLCHPIRISIVSLLSENKSLSVSEIHNKLDIEQAVASHHLSIMRDRGVLISQREGKNTLYSLKSERISDIIDCIDECC